MIQKGGYKMQTVTNCANKFWELLGRAGRAKAAAELIRLGYHEEAKRLKTL